nr:PREDICTED: solute carrier family 22 member 4-like isoform X1 [Bemisia tabaci]XP_018905231.1 PREDICTED: solute carrier family 22 member 4-like isoform X2 [Bemisia tabaci]
MEIDLDSICYDLGEYGKYQFISNILLGLVISFSVASSMSYVFSAGDLSYRCRIPECEGSDGRPEFRPDWLVAAVPLKSEEENAPAKCDRFKINPDFYDNNRNVSISCPSSFFADKTQRCADWVFKDTENTILKEFHLECDDNRWKLTLVGTINNVGQFVGLPIGGIISDAYGRRFFLVIGSVLSAVFGILRAFSTNYTMFLILEFIDAVASSGVYGAAFIIGLELVGASKRTLFSTILCCFFPIGEVVIGLVMWWLQDWRSFLLAIYVPGLFIVSYFWVIPESIRWLAMKRRYREVLTVIQSIEDINRKKLSLNLREKLNNLIQLESQNVPEINLIELSSEGTVKKGLGNEPISRSDDVVSTGSCISEPAFRKILHSRTLMIRVLNCSFCWVANTFVFYGLSLNATDIAGNKYLNYIAVSWVELPAYIGTYFLMDKVGRRPAESLSLSICGLVCLAFVFVPAEMVMLRMSLYMIGKLVITMSFTVIYVFTIEMFPTELRNSLLGTCSMLGRVGSMIAPQTPLLATYFGTQVPILLFAAVALTAGALASLFPETLHRKLPDTVEDAQNMDK